MKIVIVQPSVGVISETFIRMHAERLAGDVTVVHGLQEPSIDGVPILSRTLAGRVIRRCERALRRRNCEWEVTAAILRAIRSRNASVVLAEYGPTGVAVMDACGIAGVPLVVHFHGYDASVRDVLFEHRFTYPRMFEVASAIIAVSQAMKERLVELGAPPEKVVYIPYGVDCSRFSGARPDLQPRVFLTTGRFVEKKAPHLSIMAFAHVHKQYPDCRLRMIGDGPLLPVCRQLVRALGLDDAISFLGAQPHECVQNEMRTCRAFVQHSIVASTGDCEGTPVAILEASASGLPVVATRHAGIPDVVLDGATGILVREQDVCAMSDAMQKLAIDPTMARRMGEAARSHICRDFSDRRAVDRLNEVLASCAGANCA